MTCYAHPHAPSETTCCQCQRALCSLCSFSSARGVRCPDCALSQQPEKPSLVGAATGVVLSAVAITCYAFMAALRVDGEQVALSGAMLILGALMAAVGFMASLATSGAARKADSGLAWAGLALSGGCLGSFILWICIGLFLH